MKYLIEGFYRSIVEDGPLPIPYREILLTARIMDAIFEQLNARQLPPRALPAVSIGSAEELRHESAAVHPLGSRPIRAVEGKARVVHLLEDISGGE